MGIGKALRHNHRAQHAFDVKAWAVAFGFLTQKGVDAIVPKVSADTEADQPHEATGTFGDLWRGVQGDGRPDTVALPEGVAVGAQQL